MSLIKPNSAIKEKIQKIMSDHWDAKSNIPKYEIFAENQRDEMRGNYIQKTNEKTLSKLQELLNDVILKKNILSGSANKKKFPLTNSALLSEEKLQVEILKQRAEALAMNNNIDINIIPFLNNELENNNVDFINYYRNAVKLNTDISSELKSEMEKVFNKVDTHTGYKDLNNEIGLCSAFENKINSYMNIVRDETPEAKMSLAYIDSDIKRFESEIITESI